MMVNLILAGDYARRFRYCNISRDLFIEHFFLIFTILSNNRPYYYRDVCTARVQYTLFDRPWIVFMDSVYLYNVYGSVLFAVENGKYYYVRFGYSIVARYDNDCGDTRVQLGAPNRCLS